jgi:hypothetical protein
MVLLVVLLVVQVQGLHLTTTTQLAQHLPTTQTLLGQLGQLGEEVVEVGEVGEGVGEVRLTF